MTHPLQDLCPIGIGGYRAAMEEAAALTQGAHIRALTRPDHAEEILHHLAQRLLDRAAFAETVAGRAAREDARDDQAYRAWATVSAHVAAPADAEARQDGLAEAVAGALHVAPGQVEADLAAAPYPVATQPELPTRQPRRLPAELRAWTPERVALLKRDRRSDVDQQDLLRRINALPGREIPGVEALRMKAKALRLPAISGRGALIRDPETGEAKPQGMVFTHERLAYLRANYPTAETVADVLAGINALPGPPCTSADSLRVRARLEGLRRPPTTQATLNSRRAAMARAQAIRLEQVHAAEAALAAEEAPDQAHAVPCASVRLCAIDSAEPPPTIKQDLKVAEPAPAPTPTVKPDLPVAPEPPRPIAASIGDWLDDTTLTLEAERDAREQFLAGVGARALLEDFGGPSLDWWQAWCAAQRGRAA
jgi:hypothetical protein